MASRYRSMIVALVFVVAARGAAAQATAIPSELGWIGLFNQQLVEWLENENRLPELCKPLEGSTRWDQCKAEMMEPAVLVIPVRAMPRDDAPAIGTIAVIATPGRGLRAHAARGGVATAFKPDLFDSDWGYGPYFHQTILGREGSWYRVPIDALPVSGWINSAEWTDKPDVQHVDGIVSTPRGDMVVLGIANRELRVRPEQPADMWCGSGEPPPLKPWQEIRIPFSELFDSRGHLLIAKKYTRGC